LDVRRIVFGERSPRTLKEMLDLARSYSSQGRYIEAVKLAEEGLQEMELVFGAGHPRAGSVSNNKVEDTEIGDVRICRGT
jgi:hypothetical protein